MSEYNTIKFDGKKLKVKLHSYRAMFMFEEMANKSVTEAKTLKDNVMYLYCVLKASNKEFDYDFNAFIDILEQDKDLYSELREAIVKK